MESHSRRSFLKKLGESTLALSAFGGAREARAQNEKKKAGTSSREQKMLKREDGFEAVQEKSQTRFKNLQQEFSDTYGENAYEVVHGDAKVVSQHLVEMIKDRDPRCLVLGEEHDIPEIRQIYLDVIESLPRLALIAQEALNHPAPEDVQAGLLGRDIHEHALNSRIEKLRMIDEALRGFKHGGPVVGTEISPKEFALISEKVQLEKGIALIKQYTAFKAYCREYDISLTLLQHPFDPGKEIDSKVLELLGDDEQAVIYVGDAHAQGDHPVTVIDNNVWKQVTSYEHEVKEKIGADNMISISSQTGTGLRLTYYNRYLAELGPLMRAGASTGGGATIAALEMKQAIALFDEVWRDAHIDRPKQKNGELRVFGPPTSKDTTVRVVKPQMSPFEMVSLGEHIEPLLALEQVRDALRLQHATIVLEGVRLGKLHFCITHENTFLDAYIEALADKNKESDGKIFEVALTHVVSGLSGKTKFYRVQNGKVTQL